jgi:hypothetical protein
VVKEVITKDNIWFEGWISGEGCEISDVGIHNARIKGWQKDRYAKTELPAS